MNSTIGSTPIPAELGQTVTGAISNLNNEIAGWTCLWTGPRTPITSSTNINLNESYKNFRILILEVINANNSSSTTPTIATVDENFNGFYVTMGGGAITSPQVVSRYVMPSSDTTFTIAGVTDTNYSSWGIPYKMYGIRTISD